MYQRIRVITTKGVESMLAEEVIKKINEGSLQAGVPTPLLINSEVPVDDSMKIKDPVDKMIRDIDPLLADKPVLLLTDLPVYYGDLDYVFGFTDILRGISVVSLSRLRKGATFEMVVERAVKTAIHEIGHMNGLGHCNRRTCVMSLSFSLRDTDRKGKGFCDRCLNILLKSKSPSIQDSRGFFSGGLDETRHTCQH